MLITRDCPGDGPKSVGARSDFETALHAEDRAKTPARQAQSAKMAIDSGGGRESSFAGHCGH